VPLRSRVLLAAAIGSGKGIAAAAAGKADIGASDAYLSTGTLVQHRTLLNIPLAVSAQQINYNVPGLRPGIHLRLSGKVLAEMYQGTIKTWNDPKIAKLNKGVPLPGTRVVPVHRFDSSATRSRSPAICPPTIRSGTTTRATARWCTGHSWPGREPRRRTAKW
jgi:ABC-type phosphate transport system substrate-binding protein